MPSGDRSIIYILIRVKKLQIHKGMVYRLKCLKGTSDVSFSRITVLGYFYGQLSAGCLLFTGQIRMLVRRHEKLLFTLH